MKTIINTNRYLRKLVAIYNAFGPPDSVFWAMMKQNSWILGETFYAACEIYKAASARDSDNLWSDFLDANIKATLAGNKRAGLVALLDQLEIPSNHETVLLEKRVLGQLEHGINHHVAKFNAYSRKTFGFSVPKAMNIVVGVSNYGGTRGGAISAANMLISIDVHQDDPNPLPVLFHEMLHVMFRENNIRFTERYMEEAFLDYFTSGGLLDKALGFVDKIDMKAKHEQNVIHRPYAKRESEIAFSLLDKYASAGGTGNIWDFMAKKHMASTILLK